MLKVAGCVYRNQWSLSGTPQRGLFGLSHYYISPFITSLLKLRHLFNQNTFSIGPKSVCVQVFHFISKPCEHVYVYMYMLSQTTPTDFLCVYVYVCMYVCFY